MSGRKLAINTRPCLPIPSKLLVWRHVQGIRVTSLVSVAWLHFHMHQLVVDQNCSEWKCLAALLKIHYALRAVRNGAHEYEHLNKSPLEHHHLFGATWGDLLRTKHHLRLHLASIYRKLDTQILSHAKKNARTTKPVWPKHKHVCTNKAVARSVSPS